MRSVLFIDSGFKTIPYTPAERPDGSVCHGFKALKGAPLAEVEAIPEADLPALREALIRINAPATSFFTVGCEKQLNKAADGFWMKGYVEFAVNFAEIARDATWCFHVFFHFNRFLQENKTELPVHVAFEIQGCAFRAADNAYGFTLTAWIQTDSLSTGDEALEIWTAALRHLAEFLSTFRLEGSRRIYPV